MLLCLPFSHSSIVDVYYQGKIKPTDVVVNKIQSAETRLYQIPSSSNSDNHSRQKLTSSKDLHSAVADEEERRQKFQIDRKRERKLVKERVDELVPKEPGKQGQLEEKRARREANWERERQSGAADTELTDKDIYGGGSDYNAMLARQRQRQEMRYREKNEHLAGRKRELDAKEEKTMEMFKRMAQERFGNQ